MDRLRFIIETVRNKYRGRDIVLWGDGTRCTFLRNAIETEIAPIKYIVDTNIGKQNNISIFEPSVLMGKAGGIFVVVTCANYYQEIEHKLENYGYDSEKDYCYFYDEVKNYYGKQYCDMYGNRIIGNFVGGGKIKFTGQNSILVIEENVTLNNITIIIKDDCKVEIGQGTRVNPRNIEQITEWKILTGGELRIGENCIFFGGGQICVIEMSRLEIGSRTTVGYDYYFYSPLKSYLTIGKDCMFSHRVGIYAQDGHAIFDLKSRKRINYHNGTSVKDHVWIGYNATILKNVTVEQGAIIGANAHVNKSVPNNCIVSGNPAKIIKKNIAWTRQSGEEQLEMLDIQYKKITENKDD